MFSLSYLFISGFMKSNRWTGWSAVLAKPMSLSLLVKRLENPQQSVDVHNNLDRSAMKDLGEFTKFSGKPEDHITTHSMPFLAVFS